METNLEESDRHEREARLQALTEREIAEWKIVIGCLLRERDAFRRLATQYMDAVQAGAQKAIHACKGPVSGTVEDLAQEFFADLFEDPPALISNFDAMAGPFRPWLTRVAYHEIAPLKKRPLARSNGPRRTSRLGRNR